jgi:lipopolysaccharide cholinephosphotransferase
MEEVKQHLIERYKSFCDFQDIVETLFDTFNNICIQNKIRYYMAFGSLIGLVRDGGKIPWDYDMDIWVPFSERDKLIEALQHGLSEGQFYAYFDCIPEYPTECLRICKKGYPFTAVHLDVFFLVGCPDDESECEKYIKKLNRYSIIRSAKFSNLWFPDKKCTHLESLIHQMKLLPRKMYPSKLLAKRQNELYGKFDFDASKNCFCVGDMRYNKVFKTEWFQEGTAIIINNKEIMAPKNYDELLNYIYKNYHEYLPISDRLKEFYDSMELLEERIGYNYSENIKKKLMYGGSQK